MEQVRADVRGFSASGVSALLAVVSLLGALSIQALGIMEKKSQTLSVVIPQTAAVLPAQEETVSSEITLLADTSTSSAPIPFGDAVMYNIIGSYFSLKQQGVYTPELGQQLGGMIASGIRAQLSYKTYTESDLTMTEDTSFDRAHLYQQELKEALAPLHERTEPEYSMFASYVETGDHVHIERLRAAAAHYREAASSAVAVAVPADAAPAHLSLVNALEKFATALTALANFADDAVASTALLPEYNAAEQAVTEGFDALNTYYAHKTR